MSIGRVPGQSGISPTIVDAKGDLIAGTAADSVSRLAVGANNLVLTADSAEATGLKWAAPDPLTTKGDLFTYSTTEARLGVGNNGETLLADSGATTGLRWQPAKSINYIINGGFDFWQRATSSTFTPTNGVPQYNTADRFWFAAAGTTGSMTASRQTADTVSLQYGLRFGRASGATSTAAAYVGTNIESAQMKPLAGKAIVLSFYAKKGADFSYTPTVRLYSGTGTDQAPSTLFNGTWTGAADVINTTFSPTTTMTRYTFTGTVPTTSNELAFWIIWTPSGTAGSNDWLQIEGVQLELGSVATEFSRSGGTLQGELAACYRYFYRHCAGGQNVPFATGYYYSTTQIECVINFPVTMRGTPTLSIGSGTNYYLMPKTAGDDYFNDMTLGITNSQAAQLYVAANVSGAAGYAGMLQANNAASTISFSSEL